MRLIRGGHLQIMTLIDRGFKHPRNDQESWLNRQRSGYERGGSSCDFLIQPLRLRLEIMNPDRGQIGTHRPDPDLALSRIPCGIRGAIRKTLTQKKLVRRRERDAETEIVALPSQTENPGKVIN